MIIIFFHFKKKVSYKNNPNVLGENIIRSLIPFIADVTLILYNISKATVNIIRV